LLDSGFFSDATSSVLVIATDAGRSGSRLGKSEKNALEANLLDTPN
jgi:hypothetical protein